MKTVKSEIVDTLSELDSLQAERVLIYIKSRLLKSKKNPLNDSARQQAMLEIGQGLRDVNALNPSF